MIKLNKVTLLSADTTPKARLAQRAIEKSMEQCQFEDVKLLTHDTSLKNAVKIPELTGLEAYSNFCVREMSRHVKTSHCLLVQSDGYILNGSGWRDEFLEYDYIGAPWLPSNTVGNGGFSLRSRKLLQALAWNDFGDLPHPEDNYICLRHRKQLEAMGIKFAPLEVARTFAFEGRSWNNGIEWSGIPTVWNGQFGFHSWLTPIPKQIERPNIFHHSGDLGDIIYAMPVIKQLGGGVLFLSIDNRYPYPLNSKWGRMGGDAGWVNNIRPLLESQDYIWRTQFTHGLPFSTDYDLNKFREPWKKESPDSWINIFHLHQKAFGVNWPEDKPWLTVDNPVEIAGRPIVVARSPRYQNGGFPWWNLVQKYGDRMVFVGTESEATIFQGFGAPKFSIPFHETFNMLELAQVIAGAKVCVMNQSAPLAIAHGLGKNVIVEEWPANRNCHLNRPNAIYWSHPQQGEVEIPVSWLK